MPTKNTHRFIDHATCTRGAFVALLRRTATLRQPWGREA